MLLLWRFLILILTSTLGGLGCKNSTTERPQPTHWEVGQWVKYEISSPGKKASSEKIILPTPVMEFSIVGMETRKKEDLRGKVALPFQETLFWLEIYEEHSEGPVILKLLVTEGMKGEPKRILIQNGSNQAVEMSESDLILEEIWKGREIVEGRNPTTGRPMGRKETLPLTAGNIETYFFEMELEEKKVQLWSSESIPIWGIAKLSMEGMEMSLTAYGLKGAVSRMGEEAMVAQELLPEVIGNKDANIH